MRTTIDDIAREAGVSLATVSRVVNEKAEGVGEETRARVKAIIERTGYRPCAVARGLATGKSRTIGFVIPDVADPFFPLLIRGAENYLLGKGYGLFLCDSGLDIDKEKEHVRLLLEKRVDGIIVNSTLSDCDCQLDLLDEKAVPYVLLDRMIETREGAAGVYADNRKGAREAVGYLLDGGSRRLLHINGPAELVPCKERLLGLEDAFRERGRDAASVLRAAGDYSVESGERAVDAVLGGPAPGPGAGGRIDAVFAANDRMAIGAMRALKRRGLRIPEDVEVVGFDGIELGALVDPPLTTVVQPAFEMGRASAELLLALVDGTKPRRRRLVLEPKLAVRGTTRPR
jgi:LacI family transcriptional regulator